MNRERVQSAPADSVGFDTDTALSATTAAAFVTAGFHFAIRYLSLGVSESSGDLTSAEVQYILNSGLALMAVQHVPESGWYPTQQLGQEYGQNAAKNAESVGLPAGVNIWLDLEGVNSAASADNVTAYCNAWFAAVSAAQYVPGLYVGASAILDSDQLDSLNVEYYWKSGSNVPYPTKGYCMVQSINSNYVVDGVAYDRDVVQKDNLGNTPVWLKDLTLRSILIPDKDKESSGNSKSGWSRVVLAGLLAILVYAAGIVTGPTILAKIGYGPAQQAVTTHAAKSSAATGSGKPSASSAQPGAARPSGPATPSTAVPPSGQSAPVGDGLPAGPSGASGAKAPINPPSQLVPKP